MQITPTRAEKSEWSRFANAAYSMSFDHPEQLRRFNDIGHRYSGFAALRDADSITSLQFDLLQHDYRAWLTSNIFPSA